MLRVDNFYFSGLKPMLVLDELVDHALKCVANNPNLQRMLYKCVMSLRAMAIPERSNLKIINIKYPMDCFIPKIRTVNRKIGIRNDNVKVMQHSLQVGDTKNTRNKKWL